MNRRHGMVGAAALFALPWTFAQSVPAPMPKAARRVLEVGPGKVLSTPSAAAKVARDGDEIRIASAEYAADVAVWPQSGLRFVGVGNSKPLLVAQGANAEGKAIWVIHGDNIEIENLVFEGCRVPDRNGAGIRAEGKGLTVRHCIFRGNETAILTSNRGEGELLLEHCELDRNFTPERGFMHNIYVGRIARFEMRFCYVHGAVIGHNVKTRAALSVIEYNLITDGEDGRPSYCVEFPDGGEVRMLGNIVHKSQRAENFTAISYGAEHMFYARNAFVFVHNTVISEVSEGRFLFVRPESKAVAPVRLLNNVLAGQGRLQLPAALESHNNVHVDLGGFSMRDVANFQPNASTSELGSETLTRVLALGEVPMFQYMHPLQARALVTRDLRWAGAVQQRK